MADELVENTASQRYELLRDGVAIGFVTYRDAGGVVTLPHTYVEPAFRGHEVASRVVQYALDDLREQGRRVEPVCPYVAAWIDRHPEYADLLSDAAG